MRPRHYIKGHEPGFWIAMCGAKYLMTDLTRDTAPRCERCRVEVEKLKAPTSARAKAEKVLSGEGGKV